jgi:PPK2 family polyphosphate:nucleotide phosphotransferase
MKLSDFRADPEIKLSDFPTGETGNFQSKEEAKLDLENNILTMADYQDKLYAQNQYALLIIFQALDAAGKDGAIKHVMSGLNPQGTQVVSFKQPSAEELDHDYLWRISKSLPERGRIGVFNRSHYEEVLAVRIHDLIKYQNLPPEVSGNDIWNKRFEQIRNFEKYLYQNGIVQLKFFLHLSKKEQKKRFLKRLDDPSKNWKFSASDLKEREYWDDYQKYYEEAINETSTKYSPWYIIPADNKWFSRLLISQIINETLSNLDLKYPKIEEDKKQILEDCKTQLLNE